ncbi:DUF4304 domain-containing protein [Pararhizobium antarcticum]|uniref:DUF4304 domain-containing protein n=1 Tax=Pararhizobium antarcticum TaxID=1798805 RepID=A0A657LUD7_9HYPH|nr:DUF4304 domain-containing protein [Pararhizobium antarcticum]OJF98743.1 hypothetical protein AX760_01520 [Pararhizobium antarcticum]OJF98869.1 hypothetical protein AX760_02290 [Pararhizobium antarcticum]OJF99164.1 hypothetical protein AX761_11950 [Rhizobium sp. 58]
MGAFEQAVGRQIAAKLKADGFARRGQSFNRRRGCEIQVISLQRSRNNTALRARYTVNIGVTPDLGAPDAWVEASACRWRMRIGMLRPERQDHWYDYRPDDPENLDAAIAETLADIEAYALPCLSETRFPSLATRTTVRVWQIVRVLLRRLGYL